MAMIPPQLNAARTIQEVAQGLIEDARRMDALASGMADMDQKSQLKSLVRQILARSNSLAEAAQSMAIYK